MEGGHRPAVAGDLVELQALAGELLELQALAGELVELQAVAGDLVELQLIATSTFYYPGRNRRVAICYFVPGFLGTELRVGSSSGPLEWISYPAFGLHLLDRLELDAAGLGPLVPSRPRLAAGLPLQDYYGAAIFALQAQLAPHGLTVFPWGYDWRLDCRTTGQLLALQIVNDGISAKEPCSIAAHSLGGLVARIAWYTLGQLRCQDYCRRIVTLGAPHFGTFSGVQSLLGTEPTQRQLGYFVNNFGKTFWTPIPETYHATWIQGYVAGVMATWPATYQLIPFLFGPEYEVNRGRAIYLDIATYQGLPWVSASRLAEAKGPWQTLMADPATVPNRQVLRCMAGKSNLTAQYVARAPDGGPSVGQFKGGEGDSVVTVDEATLGSAPAYTVFASHREICTVTAGNGELRDLILDNSIIPDPPPPPIQLPAPGGATAPGIIDLLRAPTGVPAHDC